LFTPDFFENFLDSDLREDKGPDGFERAMHAEFPLNSALFMWNGSDYVRESTTLIFTAGQGEVTAMLNVRQLGSETVRFYFYADTLPVEADNFSDEAREAPQSYLVQALVPLLEDSFARPKAIRAGRRLAVDVGVWTDSDTSPSISCRARVARKTLPGKGSWKSADIPSARCCEQRAESR
jgi:hypothetical protein